MLRRYEIKLFHTIFNDVDVYFLLLLGEKIGIVKRLFKLSIHVYQGIC